VSEFDKFAASYEEIHALSLGISGESTSYFAQYKVNTLALNSKRNYLKILDFGCGIGVLDKYLSKHYPNAIICGIDKSENSILEANKLKLNNCDFIFTNGDILPFENDFFDLAICANSLHHIETYKRIQCLKEINRVVKSDGDIIIFEHNPYNPFTVNSVRSSEIDIGVELLPRKETKNLLHRAGFMVSKTEYIVFFPRFLRFLRWLEPKLGFCPIGAQYFVFGSKTVL